MRERTCCFTGHRPEKLPFGFDETHEACIRLFLNMAMAIQEKRRQGIMTFISGMAKGVDIWCAELVLDLKRAYPDEHIKLVCALPYTAQAAGWSHEWKERHKAVCDAADEIVAIQRLYTKTCFHERNRWMVDNSAHIIAIYEGDSKSGTGMTVRYAREQKLDITIIEPSAFLEGVQTSLF